MEKVSISASVIVDQMLHAPDAKLRAYAYLTASLNHGGDNNGIADALDCFVPFIVAGIEKQRAGDQLDIENLSVFLKNTFPFEIPIYALEQLLPRVEKTGAIQYNKALYVYICKQTPKLTVSGPVIDNDLSSIDTMLSEAANNQYGQSTPPFSPTWTDALIAFFKGASEVNKSKPTTVRGTIVSDSEKIEEYVIGRFIQDAFDKNRNMFNAIVRIYTGVLIEDFASCVQSYGAPAGFNQLTVTYDTAILLRLLGSSGRVLKIATLEMHRALQDLGCATTYFDHTDGEVANILDSLIYKKDSGQELYGETAEAMTNGEISLADLRDIQGTYPERLGALNIFKSKYNYNNTPTENSFQIGERQFETHLKSQATSRGKPYSQHNIQNDTKSLALIMRMRRGHTTRNAADARHIFVTPNKFLGREARSYLVRNEKFVWTAIPPIMSIGQMSTIAWLSGPNSMSDASVTKELLANCYNAVRPDADWIYEFVSALDKFKKEDPENSARYAESAVFLNTARRIALDDSYANASVLKHLTFDQVFGKAREIAEERELEIRKTGAADAIDEYQNTKANMCRSAAKYFVTATKIIIVFLFMVATISDKGAFGTDKDMVYILLQAVLLIFTLIAALDTMKFQIVSSVIAKIESSISNKLYNLLYA